MASERVQITEEKLLSDNWYVLKRFTFNYLGKNGQWTTQQREAYDRGNGATILLHNPLADTVILTRQFRLPTFVNGNNNGGPSSGMLIEACAGLLDNDDPETAIIRETEEETGYRIQFVQKVMEAYMSPGSVTEKLYFYIAHYTPDTERNAGGGIDEEEIDILELTVSQAFEMIKSGEIMDGKTIMLLQYLRLQQLS
ncbi:NUDIX domain-containing protein [Spirosoma flavum]|uniref:GDP-mannose pyrophosphatase n=1 Tax=Spirosoma flavum TaxID=2048557 RepID=A0ABW6AR37_9BACT